MRDFFSSPRRRRRTIKLGIVLIVALGVGLLIAFDRNTVPKQKEVFSKEKPTVFHEVKQVRLRRAEYFKARDVAIAFIDTAVQRKHLERSCGLVTPTMMEGMTCREWQHGDIPVVPYHPDETLSRYAFDYSFKNSVGMKVALFPRPPDRERPTVFRVELSRKGPHDRWLVNDWQPAGGPPQLADSAPLASDENEPSLAATWLLIPASIFALLLLVPMAIGVREWRRRRRADRVYPSGPLPPLRS